MKTLPLTVTGSAVLLVVVLAGVFGTSTADAQPPNLRNVFGKTEEVGKPLTVTSRFKIKEGTRIGNLYVQAVMGNGYHCYSQNHGGVEVPSSFKVPASDQFQVVGPFVPDVEPHAYELNGEQREEFEEQVTWSAPIVLADGVEPANLEILASFKGMVCNADGCRPPKTIKLTAAFGGYEAGLMVEAPEERFDPSVLSIVEEEKLAIRTAETPEELADLAALYDVNSKIKYERLDGSTGTGTFWTALFGAFVGGMLLNLMPCVFPVLGLKVMGFAVQAGSDPKKIRIHGIAFALGLIFSMWVLAGAILTIKAFGNNVSWGQQMGNAYFVGGIVIMLFVMGLNLAGVFEMGLFMTRVGGGEQKHGYSGSFVSGIITTLVATPCSGPFLGAAMGYTLAQDSIVALFLFTIFGLGIAMPYLVLSFFPALIKMLPKPGAWMETFKKLMAFTLFAAAAFFAKTFGAITGIDGIGLLLMAMCVIGLAAFFYGKYSPAYVKGGKRYLWGWATPLLIASAGIWMCFSAAKYDAPQLISKDGWTDWAPGRIEHSLAENRKLIWVDYTADW